MCVCGYVRRRAEALRDGREGPLRRVAFVCRRERCGGVWQRAAAGRFLCASVQEGCGGVRRVF